LPKALLNARGELTVDPYFAVKGAKDIYSLGDVADIQAKKALHVGPQAEYLGKILNLILTGKPVPAPYKVDNKPMGAVTVGRSKGFGVMGSWSLPNFLIQFAKGKTMMVENLPKAVAGTM
jgi:NADH dehydrogenase FAD-containing subunit